MNKLNQNQINAINISINNNFESGVHFHATGTGKSWIAMNIINEYNKKYPTDNIIWLCEKKSILIEQFNFNSLKERNFEKIIDKFHVFNFAENKNKDWINILNESKKKSILLIINRAYLTSKNIYEKLKIKLKLIIHDECHSIINKTTQKFYDFMLNYNPDIKCIGFSATPYFDYFPFTKLLSSYSIYDAYIDNIIVPPQIKWITVDNKLNDTENILLIKNLISDKTLIYKKIIVWCGMINYCYSTAKLWSKYFDDYTICIDTSIDTKDDIEFLSYEHFYSLESKGYVQCIMVLYKVYNFI